MKLTLPQQDIYFEQLLYPDEPVYNIGAKISIRGSISYEWLNQAYITLINQHDAYRSIISRRGNEVEIDFIENHGSVLEYVDFSGNTNADEAANEFMQNRFRVAFDLHSGKLLHQFILVKIGEGFHYLFSVYHHIITDGWGTSLMFQRLVQNYNEIARSGTVTTEYNYSYAEFVKDDEAYFNSSDYNADKLYWKEKFKQLPEPLLVKTNNAGKQNESRRKELVLQRKVYNQLELLAKEQGCSTFHVLLGVLYLYFGRKHQVNDFAIGIPILNRGKSVFKKTVGLFMGVSPLRIGFNVADSFGTLVKNIKQQLRNDYRHQRLPLGKLINELALYQEKDRLFNITLSYEKQDYADHFLNTETRVIPLSHQAERVALAIYIREFDQLADVKIDFDYNVNYFDQSAINRTVAHIETLINEIVEQPELPLAGYRYITTAEQQQLLSGFNNTAFVYPQEDTLLQRFHEQVLNNPEKIAVADGAVQYTYDELDRISGSIAAYLQEKNKVHGSPVAVLMGRSANLVATLLGILKSGSAYIPLDPSFPQERLAYIIQHSEAQLVISSHQVTNELRFSPNVTDVESILSYAPGTVNDLPTINAASTTAYVIYTSGSTGLPKGVAISHRSLLNFLLSMLHRPGITSNDLLFSVTTPSFDISILEYFAPLVCGATVFTASQELLSNPIGIVEQLEQLQPTIIQATPGFYQMLFDVGWKGSSKLKILCGGDLLSASLAAQLLNAGSELWNMYGPTETTIWSSCKKIAHAGESSNIGKPINNTELYVLDEQCHLLPIGSAGTIYIGGDGLAQGYVKNRELTDEKFIQNPFNNNKKIYNTGDLGKWNEQGEIEFLGRNDNQVKIRGYRIELGEIETRLNQLEYIRSSVVVAHKTGRQNEAMLVAYIISDTPEFNEAVILETLRNELPAYMIPQAILPLVEFPLTPNKKIDRKSLSLRPVAFSPKTENTGEGPLTETEQQVHDFFVETLGGGDISVADSFFSLGGHSLNAVKLINLVNDRLGCSITLKEIFDHPTVQTLAKCVEEKGATAKMNILPVPEQPYYEITPAQEKIWLAAQQQYGAVAYNMAAVFTVQGSINKELLNTVFSNIIGSYEILRTNFIEVEGRPYQQIRAFEDAGFVVEEFHYNKAEVDEEIQAYLNREFNLEKDLLLRVAFFYNETKTPVLVFCTHHIIMDGWSLELLVKQVVQQYQALSRQQAVEQKVPGFQFKDYAAYLAQQSTVTSSKNLQFWKNYLQHVPWNNGIPFDHTNADEQNRAADYEHHCQTFTYPALQKCVQQNGISLHTLLVGVFNMLLHKMYGHSDIAIATVNTGRTHAGLHNQLGMFVKTLPVRTRIHPEQNLIELVKGVHRDILLADEHQDIPEPILNTIRPGILIVLENPTGNIQYISVIEHLQLSLCPVNIAYARLPLLLSFSVHNDQLAASFTYNAALYDCATIELLGMKLEKMLHAFIENPFGSLQSVSLGVAIEDTTAIDISFNF